MIVRLPDFEPDLLAAWQDWVEYAYPILVSSPSSCPIYEKFNRIYTALTQIGQGADQREAWSSLPKPCAAEIIAVEEIKNLASRPISGATKSRMRASQKASQKLSLLREHYPIISKGEVSVSVLTANTNENKKIIEIDFPHFIVQLSIPLWVSTGEAQLVNKINFVSKTTNTANIDNRNLEFLLIGAPGAAITAQFPLPPNWISSSTNTKPQSVTLDGDCLNFFAPASLDTLQLTRNAILVISYANSHASITVPIGPINKQDNIPVTPIEVPLNTDIADTTIISNPIYELPASTSQSSSKSHIPTPLSINKNKSSSLQPVVAKSASPTPTPLDTRQMHTRRHSEIIKPGEGHAKPSEYLQNEITINWHLKTQTHGIIAVRAAVSTYLINEYAVKFPLAQTGVYTHKDLLVSTVSKEKTGNRYWRFEISLEHKHNITLIVFEPKLGNTLLTIHAWRSDLKRIHSKLIKFLVHNLHLYDANLPVQTPTLVSLDELPKLIADIRNTKRKFLLITRVVKNRQQAHRMLSAGKSSWWNPIIGIAHIRLLELETAQAISTALGDEEAAQLGDIIMFSPGAGGDDPGDLEALLPGSEVNQASQIQISNLLLENAYQQSNTSCLNPKLHTINAQLNNDLLLALKSALTSKTANNSPSPSQMEAYLDLLRLKLIRLNILAQQRNSYHV